MQMKAKTVLPFHTHAVNACHVCKCMSLCTDVLANMKLHNVTLHNIWFMSIIQYNIVFHG